MTFREAVRRDRSPSEDRERAPHPTWDNPGGQPPGTGLGAGFESGWLLREEETILCLKELV